MRIIRLDEQTKQNILEDLLKRDPNQYSAYAGTVQQIIDEVKAKGDEALFGYTRQFDHAQITPSNVRVTKEEMEEAKNQVDPALIRVMETSMANIREYHERQLRQSWFSSKPDGTILGQKITPLETVGVYVPGGKASYPSTVLMNIIPAKAAGVDRIVMVTPPGADGKVNPVTLTAACLAGVTEVYKAGGAQAIAALAFGTKSIPRVNKIVGPGNIFVALAKKAVYGHVSIDSIAGPSEILVIADETANPRYVAADLLSQAEHDELASAILVTTSMELAKAVSEQVDGFLQTLSRKAILEKSLENYGYILVADSLEDAIRTANEIASEHLEIVTKNPFEVMTKIRNAGAIFIGEYSSEPLGDYFAGPNHVLPTNGTAKFFSPLGVDDFVKKSSIIYYSREALEKSRLEIEAFANSESLTAHANSIHVRFAHQEGDVKGEGDGRNDG
ncbi:MAG: histidinol dehydrogenase [Lachnospiraceae bacterium]|nr:histidinol dehydrogenase [Lachnospiraceae bacterium]